MVWRVAAAGPCLGDPRVLEDLFQFDPQDGVDPEASCNQVATAVGHQHPERYEVVRVADLIVRLKGHVSADHVVKQYSEAPHCGTVPIVPVVPDPLGRSVHPGACKSIDVNQLSVNFGG